MNINHDRIEVFWGKIVAGFTHEIKNILATINESQGLIQDIHHLNKQNDRAYQKKIISSLEIIEQQVERGEHLSNLLNTFAHTPDQKVASISPREHMIVLIGLYHRFAQRKKVSLKLNESPKICNLLTRPVEFMHLLFVGLEMVLSLADSGDEIRIDCSRDEEEYRIRYSLSPHPPQKKSIEPREEYRHVLQKLCVAVQGRVHWDETMPGPLFIFPKKPRW